MGIVWELTGGGGSDGEWATRNQSGEKWEDEREAS